MRAMGKRAGWGAWGVRHALVAGMFLLASTEAQARPGRKHIPEVAKTKGLGKSCQTRTGCSHKSQVCLKGVDANGKEEKHGFCALPCLAIDAGTTKVVPGKPLTPDENTKADMKKAAPPRCPKSYQCRTAGAGVPIDLCIQE